MRAKQKVSVTVHGDLLRQVDRLAGDMNRSAVFEQALTSWLRHRRQVQLDDAIEAYYRGQTDAERGEDERWTSLGDDTVRAQWPTHGRRNDADE